MRDHLEESGKRKGGGSSPEINPGGAAQAEGKTGISWRSPWFLALAAVLGVLAVLWVVEDELIRASIQVGNAVPPIPALTALLGMGVAAYFFRRRRRPALGPRRILWIYLFLTIAAAIPGTASMSFFFAYITAPQYLAATQPGMARIASYFPRWFAPPPGELIRQFYEGSFNGAIPWRVWLMPLLTWGLFLFTLMLTIYAILALLRQCWMQSERLSYPMVQIPLRMLGTEDYPPIWRNGLLWLGFGLAAAFDGTNMLHAFYPSFPSMGILFDLGTLFPNKPWNSLSPFAISYRPEIFGIGYLMPTDVLLSTWVSYVSLRLSTVIRVSLGEDIVSSGYDYQELGIGAFLCLFFILLWRAIPQLRQSLADAFRRTPRTAENEPLSPRTAWSILLLGTLVMLAWLYLIGLPLWLGAAHLTLLISVAVVYARIRAETGATTIYLFPFWQQQHMITNFLGSQLTAGGNDQALTLFSSLGGLSRGYYPEISAYGAEGMSLAARARFPQRQVTVAVVAGLALGLVLGGYLYVTAGYRYGFNQLDAGTGHGGYRVYLARQQYDNVIQMFSSAAHPKWDLIFQTCLGAIIVLALNWLRQRAFWFPLHPTGFAMASAYGFHLWSPFLIVWLFKTLILRFSGNRGYRRFIPLFLGIALGRYLFAGLVWGLLALWGNPATTSYEIHFS